MTDFDPKMIEALARAICLSEGQDPDAKNISVFCDHDNRPLPIWMAFEEQAQAALSALPLSPEALGLTKDGHPKHPLYVPAAAEPVPFAGRT